MICQMAHLYTNQFFFARSRIYATKLSTSSLLNFVSYAGILSLPLVMMVLRSASDFFWTSAEWRSGIFSFSPIIVLPVPSGPWHIAHLDLNRLAPSSAAMEVTGNASMARAAPTTASLLRDLEFMLFPSQGVRKASNALQARLKAALQRGSHSVRGARPSRGASSRWSNRPSCPSTSRLRQNPCTSCLCPFSRRQTSGANRDLNDAIPSLAKELISLGDPVQRKRVRQQRPQIQPAVANQLHQPAHPFFASRAERRDNFMVAQTCSKWLERHGQLP